MSFRAYKSRISGARLQRLGLCNLRSGCMGVLCRAVGEEAGAKYVITNQQHQHSMYISLAQMRIRFGGIQGLTFHARCQYRSSIKAFIYIVAQRMMRHHRVKMAIYTRYHSVCGLGFILGLFGMLHKISMQSRVSRTKPTSCYMYGLHVRSFNC